MTTSERAREKEQLVKDFPFKSVGFFSHETG